MQSLDAYLANAELRTEQTDKAFVLSLSGYDFDRSTDELSAKLGLSKRLLKQWRASEKVAARKPDTQQGRAVELADVEPWEEAVDGVELFNAIESAIRTFLIAPEPTARIMALWAALTYLVGDLSVLPMLVFTSPMKQSGKTTALELVRRLSNKAIMASSISPAAVFRIVEKYLPTLLLDEADSVFKTNDELRTLVNGSFTRNSATVFRVVGDDMEPRAFSSFCPKALALIGHLPDTLTDRSITVPMRRKKPDEKVERLRADRDMGFPDLRAMLARWVADNKTEILECDPAIPVALNDRQADCWRELLRIADTIGGRWPEQVRADAVAVCASAEDDGDLKTELLRDIQGYFEEMPGLKQVASATLIEYLVALEGRPWAELRGGKPMTTNTLARMLRGFGIEPKTIRAGDGTPKGYAAESFKDIFARYLPDRHTATNNNKAIQDKELKCCGNVAVADSRRNIEEISDVSNKNVAVCCGSETQQKQKRNTVNLLFKKEIDEQCCGVAVETGTEKENIAHSTGRSSFVDWPAVVPQEEAVQEQEFDIF